MGVRSPQPEGAGSGFGVATVRVRSQAADYLVTVEPGGQVCAWLPPTPGEALERRTLSLDHVGRFWHGLETFILAGETQGLAGLRVDPAHPNSVELVIWDDSVLDFLSPPVNGTRSQRLSGQAGWPGFTS